MLNHIDPHTGIKTGLDTGIQLDQECQVLLGHYTVGEFVTGMAILRGEILSDHYVLLFSH